MNGFIAITTLIGAVSALEDCNQYENVGPLYLSQKQQVAIVRVEEYMEIEFDIDFHSLCDNPTGEWGIVCNILQIGSIDDPLGERYPILFTSNAPNVPGNSQNYWYTRLQTDASEQCCGEELNFEGQTQLTSIGLHHVYVSITPNTFTVKIDDTEKTLTFDAGRNIPNRNLPLWFAQGKEADAILSNVCVRSYKDPPPTIDFVKTYAPILGFDRAAASYGYPMNVQLYLDTGSNGNENNILNTVSNPTYYRAVRCNTNTVKIVYWWFYGQQHECFLGGAGAHNGDWERIIVEIVNDGLTKVTYYQHSGHYTINSGEFYNIYDWTHPVAYVGKTAHGSYYDSNDFGGGCGYFYDYRNPSGTSDSLYTEQNLIDLDTSNERWIKENTYICCSNPLTFLKDDICVDQFCDDLGCNFRECDSTNELIYQSWNCIG